jgi:NTP pyrophosphatase (non-canonical NTP hydrolase)
LNETIATLRCFRDQRDWQRFHSPQSLAMSVAIESGELLQHFQWLRDDEVKQYLSTSVDDVADEMADVMIYLIYLSEALGVSLADSVDRKIETNSKRFPAHRKVRTKAAASG